MQIQGIIGIDIGVVRGDRSAQLLFQRFKKEQKEKERVLRRAQTKRYYKRLSADKKNAKQRWTIHDIEIVLAHEQPDRVLSEQLGRSVKAILEARRVYKDRNLKEESER